MKIVGVYSFNGAKKAFASSPELEEVKKIISLVNSSKHKTKISKEKTMPGRKLYKPDSLNKAFIKLFTKKGWNKHKVSCDYPTQYYQPDYKPKALNKGAFREMDFVKNKIGVEVQFGKYAFMVYNVCAKMTIFHNLGIIKKGIEIVPVKEFADEMSTGVSYFEQFVWDLEHRGSSNIDIPVLIIGIAY